MSFLACTPLQLSQEPSDSNVPTSSRGKSRRRKLPLAAAKILEDYIRTPGFWDNNPTGMPNKSERKRLLGDIKELPGTEFYKMLNLTNWFRYRQPQAENQRGNPEDARAASTSISTSEGQTYNTRYHSLSASAITSLSTLCKDTPNPSHETIAIWVKFLRHETPGVTLEDITRFVHDRPEANATTSAMKEPGLDDADTIQVRHSNVGGLPTPGNTKSPTIAPTRPMWMTPDPFSIKARHSQSPSLPSVRSTSASTSVSASTSASAAGSISPRPQPRTPAKPLSVSRPIMDDMDVDRYTPAAMRSSTSNRHPYVTPSRSGIKPLPSLQLQSQSCDSLSPPRVLAQIKDLATDEMPTTAKWPPQSRLALDQNSQEEEDMEKSASRSPSTTVSPLPSSVGHAESSSTPESDSGILQAILQGLASVRDNTVPLAPTVARPTNKTEFDAAFACFDSTCQMIGEMLETRATHES